MKITRKKILLSALVIVVAAGGTSYALLHRSLPAVAPVVKPASKVAPKPTETVKPPVAAAFNKTQYSLTDPTSIWVVVNKQRPLSPKNYIPADLVRPNIPQRVPGNESMQVRKVTGGALETMFAAAKTDGLALRLSSGYRSYTYQVNLYNGYVNTQGQSVADTQSARPGFSEHQTGLAADIGTTSGVCNVEQCFANTTAGKWIAVNAYKYGFIIRYADGLDSITGYEYEPWHVRYIGVDLATEMHSKGVLTLEQYFDLGSAPGY